MKIKRIVLTITIICFSLCSTGCGDALYTMAEDEEATIVLYAAKMVSKYNKNQPSGIANARVRDGELDEAYGLIDEGSEDAVDEVVEEEVEDVSVNLSELPDIENTNDEVETETVEPSPELESNLSDTIGIDGMDFNVTSFDVTNEFEASSSFVLTETKGKKYLVLYLDGYNSSGSSINFKDFGTAEFNLTINGSASSKSQYSFLDNDLSIFSGNVAAGKSKDFILVFQFDSTATSDIKAIKLEVTRNGNTKSTTLSIQ